MPLLCTELWTSWASLLRSYAAAHGLNATQHAVVEVSSEEITVRAGGQWLRFRAGTVQWSGGTEQSFALTEQGTVLTTDGFGQQEEEMDIAAERYARELLHP